MVRRLEKGAVGCALVPGTVPETAVPETMGMDVCSTVPETTGMDVCCTVPETTGMDVCCTVPETTGMDVCCTVACTGGAATGTCTSIIAPGAEPGGAAIIISCPFTRTWNGVPGTTPSGTCTRISCVVGASATGIIGANFNLGACYQAPRTGYQGNITTTLRYQATERGRHVQNGLFPGLFSER